MGWGGLLPFTSIAPLLLLIAFVALAATPLERLHNNNTKMKKNKTSSRRGGGVLCFMTMICQNITTMTNDHE